MQKVAMWQANNLNIISRKSVLQKSLRGPIYCFLNTKLFVKTCHVFPHRYKFKPPLIAVNPTVAIREHTDPS